MRLGQMIYRERHWQEIKEIPRVEQALVLCFGEKKLLKKSDWLRDLRRSFPGAPIISASTAGEITNEEVTDHCITATSISLDKSHLQIAKINISETTNSLEAGRLISAQLDKTGLRFVLVLSDGSLVNGDDLVTGINEVLDNAIPVAGGLAGDGADFVSTVVGFNEDVTEGNIVAIGFYGDDLQIGFGSSGGWSSFGPTRTITNSDKNVVYEIDSENALDLYKKYLGEFAEQLPGSALLFPLSLMSNGDNPVVRTILSIDHKNSSMTFAGNMPEGGKVRLMKTTVDRLVDAASNAADDSKGSSDAGADQLALLISCVGRKLVFNNRVDEELDAVRHSMGPNTLISGFYSYGEIAPYSDFMKCQLHNQTMTITTLHEA